MFINRLPGESTREKVRNLGVVGLGLLAFLSVMRFVEIDFFLLLAMTALAPWAFLGLAIVVAGLTDWKALLVVVVAAGALVVVSIPGPVPPRTDCEVSGSNALNEIVVYSHNTLFGTADPTELAEQVSAVEADIILLQEADAGFEQRLAALLDDYPHRAQLGLQAVLSRWELTDVERALPSQSDTQSLVGATVQAPGGDVRLINVHAAPPHIPGGRASQRVQFDGIAEIESPIPVLAMGDFNADPSDAFYRSFVERGGFVDAHQAVGCGFGVTWSPLPGVGPALLGLDHALVSKDFTVEAFQVLDYAGSDHKGIAVRVSIVP